ncbi:hypothetical protein SAMN05216516_11514 [Izhakiella capsodis]|uniref:Uncharacterized protein n=1 Tax=Izhakiella capsodis TaxID=1367852 RepID=A0A1I5B849_9GAMM|nr:hypothetical protein SAMN05216516_11514 [Izhakiella capsodis]
MPFKVGNRCFPAEISDSHITRSDTPPETSLWGKIKAFFCSTNKLEALEVIRKICHPPAGTTRKNVADRFERLRTLAYGGFEENVQSGRHGENHFCILDENSREMLSVTLDDAGKYIVKCQGYRETHHLVPDTERGEEHEEQAEAASGTCINKSKIADNIKMVYGFNEDILNFKKTDRNSIALDDLNIISGINAEDIFSSPGIFVRDVLLGKLKINKHALNEYSNELSLTTDSLKKISVKWIDFLSKHGDELSLSSSLNKRNQKSETAMSDFIMKNNKIASEDPGLSQALALDINSDPSTSKTMQAIYNAFLESDKKGFEQLDSLKTPPNIGCILFKGAVITAIIRKISKLGIYFSLSPDSGISNLNFIKPKSIKNLLVNVSSQSKWRGNKEFTGVGNVFEPITFSELRYIRKNNLAVSYSNNETK